MTYPQVFSISSFCCILTHILIQYDYVKHAVLVLRKFEPVQDSIVINTQPNTNYVCDNNSIELNPNLSLLLLAVAGEGYCGMITSQYAFESLTGIPYQLQSGS